VGRWAAQTRVSRLHCPPGAAAVAVAIIWAARLLALACASAADAQLIPTTEPIGATCRRSWYGALSIVQTVGVAGGAKICASVGTIVGGASVGVAVGAGVALAVGWAVTVGIVVAGASGADAPKSVDYEG
jgi:hypothetical protein